MLVPKEGPEQYIRYIRFVMKSRSAQINHLTNFVKETTSIDSAL